MSEEIKEQSLKKILEARVHQRQSRDKRIRKFIPPYVKQIDFDATNIIDLLKWNEYGKKLLPMYTEIIRGIISYTFLEFLLLLFHMDSPKLLYSP